MKGLACADGLMTLCETLSVPWLRTLVLSAGEGWAGVEVLADADGLKTLVSRPYEHPMKLLITLVACTAAERGRGGG